MLFENLLTPDTLGSVGDNCLYIHRAPSGGGACKRDKTGERAPHVAVWGARRGPSTGDMVAQQEGTPPSRQGVPRPAIRQPTPTTPSTG